MNWEWLDGIPYFVVTVEWASGKRKKKKMVKVWSAAGTLQMWSQPMLLEHAQSSQDMSLLRRLCQPFYTQTSTANERQRGKTPVTPPSQHSTPNSPDTTTLMVHTLPWHGRGSRITFFINQFTASLNTSPPKKEICEGKTAVSSPLRDPSTYQALSVDKTPNIMLLIFFFWLLELKQMASKFYTWEEKHLFSSHFLFGNILCTCSFSAADTQKDKNGTAGHFCQHLAPVSAESDLFNRAGFGNWLFPMTNRGSADTVIWVNSLKQRWLFRLSSFSF